MATTSEQTREIGEGGIDTAPCAPRFTGHVQAPAKDLTAKDVAEAVNDVKPDRFPGEGFEPVGMN